MEFNLDHLIALKEIAKDGSFSQAATRLHLSQPAVSHQIRQLEEKVGIQLLERVGKHARPTKAGQLLLEHACRALTELGAASEKLHELRGIVAGCVRFGTGATASTYLLPPFLSRFHSRYPEVELRLVTGNTAEIAAAVMKNDLDVALVTLPVARRQLSVRRFFRDRLVAIAPITKSSERARRLTPDELAIQPLVLFEPGGAIRRVIESWLRPTRLQFQIALELGSVEAIKKLVEAGFGWSIVSSLAVKSERKIGALAVLPLDPPLYRDLGLIQRRDKIVSPALRAFLSVLLGLRTRKADMPDYKCSGFL